MPAIDSSTPAPVEVRRTTITTANLGFPRIGRDRELKWTLEKHWRGDLDAAGLADVAAALRAAHW